MLWITIRLEEVGVEHLYEISLAIWSLPGNQTWEETCKEHISWDSDQEEDQGEGLIPLETSLGLQEILLIILQERDQGGDPLLDLLATAPTSNTTADTVAKLASNKNFRPDYIIEQPAPAAKRKWGKSDAGDQPASAPSMPPPQLTYQIVQP